ncbi:protein kinase [Propionibacterium freudenreichii]|uniref:protein kinase n=1 Tax=Propionibacterium freudenreichii TaxID=1744 RepID=UPI0005A5CDED|nr:protein kinase [Propionibacterium freudenreichii]MDK9330926.1 protein kinase [Propionibacterium freudenreichii]CEI50136.1 serine/threonine protein kinase [Propionibacterium freudenreichii]
MSAESQPELPGARPYPHNLIAGDLVANRYQLEAQLNQWDAGITWRAIDRTLSRRVVVHLFNPHSPETARALEAARRAAVAVDSRFVRVLDAMDGDQPFIVTEFATGITLRSLLAHGPITALESAHIVRELADALAPMHAEGLFHRRLNPDTVVVTRTGNVKIMGFLLEAALAGATISSSDNWARQEAEDVRALGKVLYACLVARWPIDPSLAQTSQWGLPAAPMSAPGPDGPHWAPPTSVDPRVPPTVNAICIQSFDPRPDSVPLRTADEIVIALGRVLGTAEADEVLGRRIRALPADEAGENAHIGLHAPGIDELPQRAATPDDDGPATQRMPPVRGHDDPNWPGGDDPNWPFGADDSSPLGTTDTGTRTPLTGAQAEAAGSAAPRPPAPVGAGSAVPVGTVQTFITALPEPGDGGAPHPDHRDLDRRDLDHRHSDLRDFDPDRTDPRLRRLRQSDADAFDDDDDPDDDLTIDVSGKLVGPLPDRDAEPRRLATDARAYRLARWLIPLGVVLMLVIALTGMVRSCQATSAAKSAQAKVVAPASVVEFDPTADGGEAAESTSEVALATDGYPSTAWHTQEYGGSAAFGGVKPGSGLLLDLGRAHELSSVTLTLIGAPTGVQLLVPHDDANPSMSTVKDWTVASRADAAGQSVTLTPDKATSTRHLVVYLTSLPQLTNGRYQGAIAEISVNS